MLWRYVAAQAQAEGVVVGQLGEGAPGIEELSGGQLDLLMPLAE
jgi:hypothetical protein